MSGERETPKGIMRNCSYVFFVLLYLNIPVIISIAYSESVFVSQPYFLIGARLHAPVPLSDVNSPASFLEASPVLRYNQAVSSRAV